MNLKNTNQPTSTQQKLSDNPSISLQNAHGAIPYGMTNDYMFRAVLQTNNKALRGLICSLLHLRQEDILSVEITNPIILGESVKNKEFRLDIKSVIHIGFLDYTLFIDCSDFYVTYKLFNVKNYHLYSDRLTLSVVDLSHIDLATDEDKRYHIDYWAKLFKATTWEEIKMLAEKDQYINEASKTIFQLSSDEQIRKRCLDREEYYLDMRAYEREVEANKKIIEEDKKVIAENKKVIAENEKVIAEKDSALLQKDYEIMQLRSLLTAHGIHYTE